MLIGLGEARREAEESRSIRASEARFRALLEADPNAILALDENSKVTWATRHAGELFGAPVDRLIGVPLSDLVALPREEATTTSGERAVFRAETTGRRIDGTHFPAEMARSSFELDGRPFQVAVISDVSWRHEADQIRDRFLGVLSHELRTPVTSIYGGTQLLLGRGARLDPETRNELLVSVAAEAERLQRMIENLVAMARIERGGDFGGARPVLLDRIVAQLVEREKALWPEVTIKLASNGPVQMVAADEEYLAQIMRNLLSNAAKYCGPGSTVEVSLEDARGRGPRPGPRRWPGDRRGGRRPPLRPVLPRRAGGLDGARRGDRPVRVSRARRDDGRPDLGEAAARQGRGVRVQHPGLRRRARRLARRGRARAGLRARYPADWCVRDGLSVGLLASRAEVRPPRTGR